jgi:protein-S-isoprenylcysteine O-methyltransferase Ste14
MDFRQQLFRYRSYTPIPFLMAMAVLAHPAGATIIAGFPLVILGEFIRLWGVAIAGSETRTTGPVGGTFLITGGPFSYVRNPLYLGNMLMYLGAAVMSNALFPWLAFGTLLYFLFQYSLIVSLEEEYLIRAFGEQYTRYRREVARFLPRFTPYRAEDHEEPELDWKRGFISEKRTLQAIALLTALLVCIWWFRR